MRHLNSLKQQLLYTLVALLALAGTGKSLASANKVNQPNAMAEISGASISRSEHSLETPSGESTGQIAFTVREKESQKIYLMNADGTNRIKLTDGYWDSWPAWSPDGSRIAFKRKVDKDSATDLYVMNAAGDNQELLARAVEFQDPPAWSPDGSRIAFASAQKRDSACSSCGSNIYVINSDGGNEVRLTQQLFDKSPTWSPDSKRIAFVDTASIYVMDADGSNQVQLPKTAPQPYFPSSVSWSPKDSEILIWGFEPFKDSSGLAKSRATIRVISAPGGNGKGRLMGHGMDPVWSPDGSKIAFERSGQIYVMDSDGNNQVRLTTAGENFQPAWGPASPSIQEPISRH